MNSLRKYLFALLLILLVMISASALANTTYSLSPVPAEFEAPNTLERTTVLTSENAGSLLNLLSDIGISKNDLLADFEARGVILQGWAQPGGKKPACLEITVTKNDLSTLHPDLIHDPNNRDGWKALEAYIKDRDLWTSEGYKLKALTSSGRKRAESNYYFQFEYLCSDKVNGYVGFTTWQGYLIAVNQKVYNQSPVHQHEVNIYNVIRAFRDAVPAAAAALPAGADGSGPSGTASENSAASSVNTVPLNITVAPPAETNTNIFTVEGTTKPGSHVIGVLMPISLSHAVRFEADADAKKGSFKMKVTLPENEETTWLMTLNVFVDEKLSAEYVCNTTVYKKTLIPVAFDSEVPETYAANELVVSGTTLGITEVQCLVTSASDTWEKKIRTNHSGIFNFKIPMKNEGSYSVTLSFSKKGSDIRRFQFNVARYLTDEARNAQIRKEAKRESYSDVAKRIDQYVGQTLTFRGWVTSIDQIGEEWRISVAGAKTGSHYSQYMVFMSEQEPAFAVDEIRYFYGKCIGPYQYQSEEGTESVPSFDLLVWD